MEVAATDEKSSPKVFEFPVNRNLLDPNFDHYTLTNQKLASSIVEIPNSAFVKKPSDGQWGLQQLKLYQESQSLFHCPFYPGSNGEGEQSQNQHVFYVINSEGAILEGVFQEATPPGRCWTPFRPVANLSLSSNDSDAYLPNIMFFNEKFACASNGAGTLKIYHVSREEDAWREVFTLELPEDEADVAPFGAFILRDVRYGRTLEGEFEVLLQTAEQNNRGEEEKHVIPPPPFPNNRTHSVFVTKFLWLNIADMAQPDGEFSFTVRRTRHFSAERQVDFALFDQNNVVLLGTRAPRFTFDSLKPDVKGQKVGEMEQQPEEMPPMAVIEEMRAEDEAMMETEEPTMNPEQLEDCDKVDPDDNANCFWLDGDEHRVTKMAPIDQFLFTTRVVGNNQKKASTSFVTRHDVDGIVWSFVGDEGKEPPVEHQFTLNAFGYIHAGHHAQIRFSGCSPKASYAVLVNQRNHAFVYLQKASVSEDFQLKNRKSGALTKSVAKQLVISLSSDTVPSSQGDLSMTGVDAEEEFVGFYAAEHTLFLMTPRRVYAFNLGTVI